MRSRDNNGRTNQRLWLLVGPVVVCALVVLVWAVLRATPTAPHLVATVLVALGVVGAAGLRFHMRFRAAQIDITVISTVILIATAFLPPPWVVIAAVAGLTLAMGQLFVRQRSWSWVKFAFNVGKEVLSAAAAAAAVSLVGLRPLEEHGLGRIVLTALLSLGSAIVAYAIVDEIVAQSLFSILSRTPLHQLLLAHWDTALISRLGSLAIAIIAVGAYRINPWLISVVPPMAFALHLTSANRFRGREENEAWQRLAQATDELNVVDLDAVLHTAVRRATALFSADEVEVELGPSDASPRLVRGNGTDIAFDGAPAEAPVATGGYAIPIGLESNGELRLRFRGSTVKLSEREQYTLRTFAAALSTAVRNASTFAETQRLAESHARAAAQDPLTGLANRRRLHQYGTEVLSAVPSRGVVALLLIDLNHFKEVNDTLGHAAGDHLLIEVGHRLAASVGTDDLVARLGGDEFAVLFVNLSAPAVAAVRAQALLAALAAPIDLEGMRISVEASGGVAAAPSSGGIGELLRRADVAMYQAKRNSQRVVVYADARDTADVGSLTLGGDLARAVAEREFTVNFQPIVDLGTGQAIAAEALTRWHHPDRGDLAPARFLDAVERSGQLAAFADAVLDQALEAAADWARHGFPMPVAVNVSPRSLLDPQFPESVARRLSAHHLDADILMIELTESVTLSQLEVVDEVLGALRDFGVRLALDDFGTGYSSLATLARVAVDEIKIDRSFVARIDEAAPGAVVRSTIELGRSLNLIVVAEGVEHEDQRRRLWELGCPAGQGHLFARALPPERLLAALERGGGALAPPLHEAGSVIRMPMGRRSRQLRADGTA